MVGNNNKDKDRSNISTVTHTVDIPAVHSLPKQPTLSSSTDSSPSSTKAAVVDEGYGSRDHQRNPEEEKKGNEKNDDGDDGSTMINPIPLEIRARIGKKRPKGVQQIAENNLKDFVGREYCEFQDNGQSAVVLTTPIITGPTPDVKQREEKDSDPGGEVLERDKHDENCATQGASEEGRQEKQSNIRGGDKDHTQETSRTQPPPPLPPYDLGDITNNVSWSNKVTTKQARRPSSNSSSRNDSSSMKEGRAIDSHRASSKKDYESKKLNHHQTPATTTAEKSGIQPPVPSPPYDLGDITNNMSWSNKITSKHRCHPRSNSSTNDSSSRNESTANNSHRALLKKTSESNKRNHRQPPRTTNSGPPSILCGVASMKKAPPYNQVPPNQVHIGEIKKPVPLRPTAAGDSSIPMQLQQEEQQQKGKDGIAKNENAMNSMGKNHRSVLSLSQLAGKDSMSTLLMEQSSLPKRVTLKMCLHVEKVRVRGPAVPGAPTKQPNPFYEVFVWNEADGMGGMGGAERIKAHYKSYPLIETSKGKWDPLVLDTGIDTCHHHNYVLDLQIAIRILHCPNKGGKPQVIGICRTTSVDELRQSIGQPHPIVNGFQVMGYLRVLSLSVE